MRTRIAGLTFVFSALLAGLTLADAPLTSQRPDIRPVLAAAPSRIVLATAGTAVRLSARPLARPENLRRRTVVRPMVPVQPAMSVAPSRQGSVCGVRSIKGQNLAPIPGRLKGCGIPAPVRVTSLSGVALSRPATLNCQAAKALNTWVEKSVKPTVGRLGGGAESLTVLADYSCRTRNNKPGAKLSEHATGNAIDIAEVRLANGSALNVLQGWNDPSQRRILRSLHKQACGTFNTVLGPESDRFHRDHFHLDVARYRNGTYCE